MVDASRSLAGKRSVPVNLRRTFLGFALSFLLLLAGCGTDSGVATSEANDGDTDSATTQSRAVHCDEDDGGLELPDGFCATVFADDLGTARHLTVGEDGDVYVFLRRATSQGGIVALRDSTDNGTADRVEYFSDWDGTGIGLRNGYLYASPGDRLIRYPLGEDELVPSSEPETVVSDLYAGSSHAARPITFDNDGHVYVNVGAPSNNCMEQSRTRGSPGMDPCPILDYAGGIWQYDADESNQTQENAKRYATGIRNAVAIDWDEGTGALHFVQHGRDQLNQFFPDLYSPEENAELPAEEFHRVEEGEHYGWPYCYYDQRKEKNLLAPEYGGDKETVGRCADYPEPLYGFPGHWAPNDLLFYSADQFPESYRGGAFVAFHGSWNRSPLEQRGYKVAFVPFEDGQPTVEEPKGHEVFADGFAGVETIESPGDAEHRPMGLATGPDGSLYVSDSQQGRIWKVSYTGQ